MRKLDAIERARVARAEQAALAAIQPTVAKVEAPVAKVEIVKPVVQGCRCQAGRRASPWPTPASVTSAPPIITSIAPRPTPST